MSEGRLPDPSAATYPETVSSGRIGNPGSLGRLPEPTQPDLNPTPWGFVKNFVGGIGAAVKGISDLIGMGAHDVIGAVQQVIPGQQSIETGIEQSGYQTATLARVMLPGSWVPGPDLGGKYGAIASDFAQRYGSPGKFLRGLYEDPIAYVADALILADGVGLAAKAGRLGPIASKLPKVLPDATAASIIGPRVRPFASVEAGTEALRLSVNPLRRGVQNKVYDTLSLTPEQARLAWTTDSARATAALAGAEEAGLRILRPTVSSWLAKHNTSKLLSVIRVNRNVLSAEAIEDLSRIIPNDLDPETVGLYKEGLATPLELPDTSPIDLPTDLPKVGLDDVPDISPMDPRDAQILSRRKQSISLESPDRPGVVESQKLGRYQVEVDSLDSADVVGKESLRSIGAEPIAVLDGFADSANPWSGVSYLGRKADGSIVEISIVDRNLARAQHAASKVNPWLMAKSSELDAELTRLAGMGDNVPDTAKAVVAARIADLKTELKATREVMDGFFDDARAQWHADHDGPAYDSHLKAAWLSRSWDQLELTRRWFASGKGSFATQMERAYGSQRISLLQSKMAQWRPEVEAILAGNADDVGTAAANVATYLRDKGLPDPIVDTIVAKLPESADGIMDRIRDNLWDVVVEEGGNAAAFNAVFSEFDWRVMHDARKAAGLPTASYMPHFPDAKISDFIRGTGGSLSRPGQPGPSKNWAGILFERGYVSMDARSAAERAARIMISHQEMNELIDNIVGRFGRKLDEAELELYQNYGNPTYQGEVFTSPQKIKTDLDARSKVMTDTVLGVGDGKSLDGATIGALDNMSIKIFEDGVNNLVAGEVYAVPKAVARQLEREAALQLGHAVRLFWDTPMSLWKASVLSLSPRWLVNNFFGNLIFMGLENPGAVRYAVTQLNSKNRRMMQRILGSDIVETVESGFYRNAGGGATADVLEGMPKISALADKSSKFVTPVVRTSRFMTRVQSTIEEAARRGTLLNAAQRQNITGWAQGFHSSYSIMEKLFREGITPENYSAAVRSVDRTLGNYMRYSPVEQGIMRRFITPFYGFYRHAVNVVVRMPFEHPLKTRVLQMVNQFSSDFEESMPEYLRDQAALRIGMFGGKDTVARFANFNPLNNFFPQPGNPGPAMSLLNPAIKVFYERQMGIDSFTGDPFKTPEDMVETHDGTFWQIVRDGNGNVIGVERTGRPLPGVLNHVGGQFGLLNMLPPFNRYPKAAVLQAASYLGMPMSQPKTSLASSLEFEQEIEQEALTSAASDPFGDVFAGAFPSAF